MKVFFLSDVVFLPVINIKKYNIQWHFIMYDQDEVHALDALSAKNV